MQFSFMGTVCLESGRLDTVPPRTRTMVLDTNVSPWWVSFLHILLFRSYKSCPCLPQGPTLSPSWFLVLLRLHLWHTLDFLFFRISEFSLSPSSSEPFCAIDYWIPQFHPYFLTCLLPFCPFLCCKSWPLLVLLLFIMLHSWESGVSVKAIIFAKVILLQLLQLLQKGDDGSIRDITTWALLLTQTRWVRGLRTGDGIFFWVD